MNPWGITDVEAAVLDLLIETGNMKVVAKELGISLDCARERLRRARYRMAGMAPKAGRSAGERGMHTISACIQWFNWSQAAAEGRA